MQIVQRPSAAIITTGNANSASQVDELAIAAASAPEAVTTETLATSTSAGTTSSSAALRGGLRNWDQSLNGELADAQQTLDFINQNLAQLQGLKTALSAKLAGQQVSSKQVDARLQQYTTTWDQRQSRSGDSLSSQLVYSSPEAASQRFSIRGMNMNTLQAGGKETLSFSLGGSAQSMRSISITPGLSQDEIVKRFDQALAPANIRVSKSDAGALIFTTDEKDWTAVRDTLAVKGDGIRFPSGQFTRIQPDAEPAAVQPANWQASDIESMRQTLQQVVQAMSRMTQAREVVQSALAAATARVSGAEPAAISATPATLASGFTSTSSAADYQSFSVITAALLGVSRDRVLSLLGLRQG